MEFFIKSGANLPLLKLYLIRDGRSDFQLVDNNLNATSIFFSTYDVNTGLIKISQQPCTITTELDEDGVTLNYVVEYKFTTRQTSQSGRYKGEFVIQDSTGSAILPLRQELFVNITESITEVGFCCK
jgi:hypothetical protein